MRKCFTGILIFFCETINRIQNNPEQLNLVLIRNANQQRVQHEFPMTMKIKLIVVIEVFYNSLH